MHADIKGNRKLLDIVDRDVACLALYMRDKRPVEAALRREILLGPLPFSAKLTQFDCEDGSRALRRAVMEGLTRHSQDTANLHLPSQ